jgi:hypothetical protein
MNQDDLGHPRLQCLQTGPNTVLAGGATGNRWQMRHTVERAPDRYGVTNRLQKRHVSGQAFGRMADNWLAGERNELLRGLGAEPAPRSGRHQDRCYPHICTVAGSTARVNRQPTLSSVLVESSKGLCRIGRLFIVLALRIGRRVVNLPN